MNIDDSAIDEVQRLNCKYKETWGTKINLSVMPREITQEKLAECIELMIQKNVSLLVAYNILFVKQ